MAVPFTQQATEALYWHSSELSDLMSENIAIVGALAASNKVKIITGGRGWNERVAYGSNPNSGHRSRYTQVPTDRGENMTMAQYDGGFYSSSVVVNKVDVAEAKGEWALGDLVADSWDIAKTDAVQNIGEALWATSKVNANYPIPLPVFLPQTLPAAQTGTSRGGIDSAANDWWRSQAYTTAIADISATAGLRILQQQMNLASRSSNRKAQPNFGFCTSANFTRFTSTTEAYRRFTSNERMAKLGFENVMYGPMTILWDTQCGKNLFYFINSNHWHFKALKMPHMQSARMKTGELKVPMVIEPMRDDIDTINFVSLMYLKYALTCKDLASGGSINATE